MSLFITIEGIEGSGKSTLQEKLGEALRREGRTVCLTREPGGTALGEKIRSILLQKDRAAVSPVTELLLFCADRAQHVSEVIRPALARKEIVICDRYIHSTYAYQGFGRGGDLNELRKLTELATGGLAPDLVLLVDLDPTKGLKRARARQDEAAWNRFEEEAIEFHGKVRNGFLTLARESADRFAVLDGDKPADVVFSEALKAIATRLKKAA